LALRSAQIRFAAAAERAQHLRPWSLNWVAGLANCPTSRPMVTARRYADLMQSPAAADTAPGSACPALAHHPWPARNQSAAGQPAVRCVAAAEPSSQRTKVNLRYSRIRWPAVTQSSPPRPTELALKST